MSHITIEHNPIQEGLQELGVADCLIWEKEISLVGYFTDRFGRDLPMWDLGYFDISINLLKDR